MPSSPIAAVVGDPIAHSLSPLIFEALGSMSGKAIRYERIRIEERDFKANLDFFRKEPVYLGWNVTLPHKEAAARLADLLSPEARVMGACNVLLFRHGKVRGFNTDAAGILLSLRRARARIRGQHGVVLGTGGSSRAALYALGKSRAASVLIMGRRPSAASALAREFKKAFPQTRWLSRAWNAKGGEEPLASVVIQCTPMGMQGVAMPAGFWKSFHWPQTLPDAVALDLIYRPLETPFLNEAKKRKMRPVGGLDMLIGQALETWRIWFPTRAGTARDRERWFVGLAAKLRQEMRKRA